MQVMTSVLARTDNTGPYVSHPVLDATALNHEILMSPADLSVQVVPTVDEVADGDPHRIRSMMLLLDMLGGEFNETRASLRAGGYHGLALFEELEATRQRLFYGPSQGSAWSAQKGCATALLTLMEAGRGHPNLSATVGPDVLDTVFADGTSLEELLVKSRADFFGQSREDAVDGAKTRMSDLEQFINGPLYPRWEQVLLYGTDGLGIRSRKQIVTHVVVEFVRRQIAAHTPLVEPAVMVSIGCGTALPVFDIARDLKFLGIRPELVLVDQDPIALAFALELARQRGLSDHVEIHCTRLFDRRSQPVDITAILNGRTPLLIEDTGLREYLPDTMYKTLTSSSWQALAAGGLLVSGNMNANRPQAQVLNGLIGWQPKVFARTLAQAAALHVKAGIDIGELQACVTKDGVYTVYVAEKVPQR